MPDTQVLAPLKSSHTGSIYVRLSQDELKLLDPIGDGYYSQRNLDFVDASRIEKYECNNCNAYHKGAPGIYIEIDKDPTDDLKLNDGIIGEAIYKCNECDKAVHINYIRKTDKFDVKLIRRDESGEYVKPTVEAIESELEKALKIAEEGVGRDLESAPYDSRQRVAERWARKIGHTIPAERLTALEETYQKAWLADYEANFGERLSDLEERCYFSLEEDETAHFTPFDTSCERFMAFFNALPKLKIPDNQRIKERVCALLNSYQEMHENYAKAKREKINELEIEAKKAAEVTRDIKIKIANLAREKGLTGE